MKRKEMGINPLLVTIMTGVELQESEVPRLTMLPGITGRMVFKRITKINPPHPPKKQRLRCTECGHTAGYDLGLIAFDIDKWKSDKDREGFEGKKDTSFDLQTSIMDYLQFTGYFRCSNCNSAGAWELASSNLLFELMAGMMRKMNSSYDDSTDGVMYGGLTLHDGSRPRWMSEGEEHFLEQLKVQPEDGYLWNKLGNLYFSGGRPELAAAVFEHSVSIDASQMESHYSLGKILLEIGEMELAAKYLRQAVLYAGTYTRLGALELREMLAVILYSLFELYDGFQRLAPSLFPAEEEIAMMEGFEETAAAAIPTMDLRNLNVIQGDLKSFYPVAEMYMGSRAGDLPAHERKLKEQAPAIGGTANPVDANRFPLKGWGSKQRPIIIRAKTEARMKQVQLVCDHFGWNYMMGMEFTEDLSDLEKAIKEKLTPDNIYDPCPCGSGKKFKFCCASTMKNFDLDVYLAAFTGGETQ